MPLPRGGRHEAKIVTAEDQLPRPSRQARGDATDADHLFFASRAPDSRHGRLLIGGKTHPRANPNQPRRKKR
jgi:hypothetical protein